MALASGDSGIGGHVAFIEDRPEWARRPLSDKLLAVLRAFGIFQKTRKCSSDARTIREKSLPCEAFRAAAAISKVGAGFPALRLVINRRPKRLTDAWPRIGNNPRCHAPHTVGAVSLASYRLMTFL